MSLTFIETSIFTKRIKELMSDENYSRLQTALINNPEFGDVIKGAGGLRKIRWGNEQKGKSGGIRVIYYLRLDDGRIFMLYAYAKNEQEDLTKEQLRILSSLRGAK
jgi:mRNA-degrading endonuclease RelE of RelBE toxin-antitoxin system